MSKLSERVAGIVRPVVEEEGCSLWDVEYVREAGTWYLRVYIDKENGVSIQDCENFSRALDPILDEADPIPDSYTFEVSSAGAERVLKRPGDFQRFIGSEVEVKLYSPMNGSKAFVGALTAYEDGMVTITDHSGENTVTISKKDAAYIKLDDFD